MLGPTDSFSVSLANNGYILDYFDRDVNSQRKLVFMAVADLNTWITENTDVTTTSE